MQALEIAAVQIELQRVVGLEVRFFAVQREVGRPAAIGFRIGIGRIGDLRQLLFAGVDKAVAIGIRPE